MWGRDGSPRVGARIGHVGYMLFVSISFALDSQHKLGFQWSMGFKVPCEGFLPTWGHIQSGIWVMDPST